MAYQQYRETKYEVQLYGLLHCSLDRLIDLGSRLEAHGDVLATHEQDEETGEVTKLPDVHPEDLLIAPLFVAGSEEEFVVTEEYVKVVSRIMIIRNARNIIQTSQAS